MLQLDFDLEQIGQEREERSEWESNRKESNEPKLDDGFVVVEDESLLGCGHHELLLDLAVHLEVLHLNLIARELCLLDGLLEELLDLVDLSTDQDLFFVELEDVEEHLLEHHDDEQIQCESLKVLIVADGDKVGDVIIDELEDVDLVDH